MGINNDKTCNFCKEHDETIIHLFWNCRITQLFLNDVKLEIASNYNNFEITCKEFILGNASKNECNVLFLELKKYIFSCKRKTIIPNKIGFKGYVQFAWNVYNNSNISDAERDNWAVVRNIIDQV